MAKATKKRSNVLYKRKRHFLPPSSPYRLPLSLLTLLSLSFFILLIGIIMVLSLKSKVSRYAFSPEYTTRKINLSGDSIIKKASAEASSSAENVISPTPGAYCLDVPILMYHHVQPLAEAEKLGHAPLTVDRDIFEGQLAYLNEQHYTTITLDSLAKALQTHTSVPPRSIVLTFDDGYIDMYTYVFPLLKKYNIIGNFMISTGLLENTDYMTWDEVKEMSEDPHVFLYNHTWSHNELGKSDKERIDFELEMSKQEFIDHLGHMSNVMAYPYGSYNDLVIQELKAHGFTAAVTTEGGRLQCDSYLMKLKRDHAGNYPLSGYGL